MKKSTKFKILRILKILPYYICLGFVVGLWYLALPTLKLDDWGFHSIYYDKVLFYAIFIEISYIKGYLRTPKFLMMRFSKWMK